MSKKNLIQNILSLGSVQLVTLVLPLVALPYLAVTLGAEQLGRIAFVLSISQILVILTDYGFSLSAAKAISINRNDPNKIAKIWSSVTLLRILFAIVGLVCILCLAWISKSFRSEIYLMLAAYTMVIGNVLFPQFLFQGLERLKIVSIIQIITRILVFCGIFILVKKPEDVYWAAFLQSVGLLLGALAALPYSLKILSGTTLAWPTKVDLQTQLEEGWHFFASTATTNIYTNGNIIFLGIVATPAVVGYYHIAEKIIRATQLAYGPISAAIYPYISNLATQSPYLALKFNRKLIIIFGCLGFILSIIILTLSPILIELIFKNSFIGAIPILQIFSPLPLILIISNILGIQTMLNFGLQSKLSKIYLLAATFNIMIFIPMAKYAGAEGAAFANVLVELFIVILMFKVLNQAGKNPLNQNKLNSIKFKSE